MGVATHQLVDERVYCMHKAERNEDSCVTGDEGPPKVLVNDVSPVKTRVAGCNT